MEKKEFIRAVLTGKFWKFYAVAYFIYLKSVHIIILPFSSPFYTMPILARSPKFRQSGSNEKSFNILLEIDHRQQNHHSEHSPTSSSGLYICHNTRLGQLLLPAMVSLGGLLVWRCVSCLTVWRDAASDHSMPFCTCSALTGNSK